MFELLFTNPIVLLFVVTIVMVVTMFIVIRPDKKKKGKKTSKKETSTSKKDGKSDNVVDEQTEEKKDKLDEVKDESVETVEDKKSKRKVKRTKEKPAIEPVFKKKVEESAKIEKQEEFVDDDLEVRAQFVKTSGKVSKFIGISDINERDQIISQMQNQDIEEVEMHDDCEICEQVKSHFDHSRRLSKIVKEDLFDQMFVDHLTSKYMNIDEGRHLKNIHSLTDALYDRAMRTLSNSEVKVLVENKEEKTDKPVEQLRNDRAFMKEWLENQKREQMQKIMVQSDDVSELDDVTTEIVGEHVDLSARNIMVVDSILTRKGKKTIKK